MKAGIKSSGRLASFLVIAGIGACFIYLLRATWFRWGDIMIDTFRDVWACTNLLHGKVLYKDFFYEYGFFTPQFLAALFRIFGIKLAVLAYCGIAVALLECYLIYKIARFFLERAIAFLCAVTFLFVCAFSNYLYPTIFTFILPYSSASTFFIPFVSFALYSFVAYIYKQQNRFLLWWIFFMVMAFLARIDLSFLVWLGFGAVAGVMMATDGNKKRWRFSAFMAAPFIISTVSYTMLLAKTHALSGFLESHSVLIGAGYKDIFFSGVLGTDQIGRNILLLLESFLVTLSVAGLLGAASYLMASFFRRSKSWFALMIGALTVFVTFLSIHGTGITFYQYRCLPLLLVAGVVFLGFRIYRGVEVKENTGLLAVFLISLMLIFRILFKTSPFRYGFYLLDTGIICYYIFFFKIVTDFLSRHIKEFPVFLFMVLLSVFSLRQVFDYWSVSRRAYLNKTFKIETERGRMYCASDAVSRILLQTIQFLRENTRGADTVVCLPDGGGINFFAGRDNPLRYFSYAPPTFVLFGEDNVISQVKKNNVDYIVIVYRPTFEHGYPFFGVHYAMRLYSWIRENYTLIKVFGSYPFSSEHFGTAIYKKKH